VPNVHGVVGVIACGPGECGRTFRPQRAGEEHSPLPVLQPQAYGRGDGGAAIGDAISASYHHIAPSTCVHGVRF
jgi:hypothetical protein